MSQCWKEIELWDTETCLQEVGCHTCTPLRASEGSGAQTRALPGSLGERSTVSTEIVGGPDNTRCEDKHKQRERLNEDLSI